MVNEEAAVVSAPTSLDSVAVAFDDSRSVADAGLILSSTLAERLGLERLINRWVGLGRRPGAFRPGRKVMTLVHAILAGADSIDDCDVLRSGSTGKVLGHRVMAPSTLGTFLRAFSFGHVRQLDRVLGEALARAWKAGAGPGKGRLVIDVDSFVGEVCGRLKQGAAYGYTRCSAITRCWRPAPTPARSCTCATARGRPTPSAASSALPRSSSRGSDLDQ